MANPETGKTSFMGRTAETLINVGQVGDVGLMLWGVVVAPASPALALGVISFWAGQEVKNRFIKK